MDDEYGDDAGLGEALQRAEGASRKRPAPAASPPSGSGPAKVQQPKPQALPTRQGPSSILVSPRQKGNPILNHIQSVPWEYSDTPADYVLGATTCALFLSLKYHRLHPEYIYSRIRALAGKYRLRVLLTMVDIDNHEDPLKELSKTSLINNLTLVLCWSAAEAGRYLSLYKTYEHASPSSIRAQQATGYSDRLVEFVTVPRSINKTDAISLVGNFGSVRAAINAQPEEIALIGGWGDKKVANWCSGVRDGFRLKKARRRGAPGVNREDTQGPLSREDSRMEVDEAGATTGATRGAAPVSSRAAIPIGMTPSREATRGESDPAEETPDADMRPSRRVAEDISLLEPDADEEEAMFASVRDQGLRAAMRPAKELAKGSAPTREANTSDSRGDAKPKDAVSEGIMAALARLREKG